MTAKFQLWILVLVSCFCLLAASRLKRQGYDFNTGDGREDSVNCVTKDTGQTGVCTELANCEEATTFFARNTIDAQKTFLLQRQCKFEGKTPLFCCVTGGQLSLTTEYQVDERDQTQFKSTTEAQLIQSFVFDTSGGGGGEKCVTKDTRQTGVCIETVKCDEATRILVGNPSAAQRRFLQQRTCKFEGSTPYFCCVTGGAPPQPPTLKPTPPPVVPTTPQPRVPDQPSTGMLTEADLNKVCGVQKTTGIRVVGGAPAALGQFPWMAAIFVGQVFTFVSCGGVLISEQFVLTAAHCIVDKATGKTKDKSDYTIRLGDLDISTDADNASPVDFKLMEMILHPEYNAGANRNDIALMKLDRKTKFNDLIVPICLPTIPELVSSDYAGKKPTIAGWGAEEFQGKPVSNLQFVVVDVISNAKCQEVFQRFKVTLTGSHMCAGSLLGGKGGCLGDGGGPLMLSDDDNRWYSIGVISMGFKCGEPGFPDIYTRTTAYLDWIKKNAHIQ